MIRKFRDFINKLIKKEKDKIDLNLQDIINNNKLEYVTLPDNFKGISEITGIEVLIYSSYKDRLQKLLINRKAKFIEKIVKDKYTVNVYKLEYTDKNKNYWEYTLGIVFKNDVELFSIIRNYSGIHFEIEKTPRGDFFITSENYESVTIIDINEMKIYSKYLGWCPFGIESFYNEDTNILDVSTEGCFWGCEGYPDYLEMKIDLNDKVLNLDNYELLSMESDAEYDGEEDENNYEEDDNEEEE